MKRDKYNRLGKIPKPVLQPNANTVQFPFKHLDDSNLKFLPEECPAGFWPALVLRLREYSYLSVEVFLDQNNSHHRHIVDFPNTTEPNGFTSVDTEQLAYQEAWQFDLHPKQVWRIAGILLDDMFYIIWLDHGHRLYP